MKPENSNMAALSRDAATGGGMDGAHGVSRPTSAGNERLVTSAPTDRVLKLTLSQEEFGVLNWAQRMATGGAHGVARPTGLAPFARRALFEAVRRVIAEVANQGGRIPPGVAKDYETWKNET